MAGLYFHIPFCRKACRYCDFHFTVSVHQKEAMINAMVKEIASTHNNYVKQEFNTLYFGGGTPSVLDEKEIKQLLFAASEKFNLTKLEELTFEANPDDLNEDYLKMLKDNGFNRLSIGIQSFQEKDLELLRRSHTAKQAKQSIEKALKLGFKNLTIDLIYGIPGLDFNSWKNNLETLTDFEVNHISAYHLTFEPGTVFDHWRKKGRIEVLDEKESLKQFDFLISFLKENKFLHYEISNFAKEGFISKHNFNYWNQTPYLGIGPSAHSFDGKERKWNISNNKSYIELIDIEGGKYYEKELLREKDVYNEYMITGLRTYLGVDLNEIMKRFGDNYVKYTQKTAKNFLEDEKLVLENEKLKLTKKGIMISDFILEKFLKV